jgi:hypothetical protein
MLRTGIILWVFRHGDGALVICMNNSWFFHYILAKI